MQIKAKTGENKETLSAGYVEEITETGSVTEEKKVKIINAKPPRYKVAMYLLVLWFFIIVFSSLLALLVLLLI